MIERAERVFFIATDDAASRVASRIVAAKYIPAVQACSAAWKLTTETGGPGPSLALLADQSERIRVECSRFLRAARLLEILRLRGRRRRGEGGHHDEGPRQDLPEALAQECEEFGVVVKLLLDGLAGGGNAVARARERVQGFLRLLVHEIARPRGMALGRWETVQVAAAIERLAKAASMLREAGRATWSFGGQRDLLDVLPRVSAAELCKGVPRIGAGETVRVPADVEMKGIAGMSTRTVLLAMTQRVGFGRAWTVGCQRCGKQVRYLYPDGANSRLLCGPCRGTFLSVRYGRSGAYCRQLRPHVDALHGGRRPAERSAAPTNADAPAPATG